jgi:hypothetical protein
MLLYHKRRVQPTAITNFAISEFTGEAIKKRYKFQTQTQHNAALLQ